MNNNIVFDLVRLTEMIALNASQFQGKDQSLELLNRSREISCQLLNQFNYRLNLKNDHLNQDADVFTLPENMGIGDKELDLMLIPVEAYEACSQGIFHSCSFIGMSTKDTIKELPRLKMLKIAANIDTSDVIDLNESITTNIKRIARYQEKYIEHMTVCVLRYALNDEIIKEIKASGARIRMIEYGDVSAAIATVLGSTIDIFIGYGNARETVMTAMLMNCIGGNIYAKLIYNEESDYQLAEALGITDPKMIFDKHNLITGGDISIAATGITDGFFLEGVKYKKGGAVTNSFITRKKTRTYRNIKARHYFDHKPLIL